jgi:16S rRNA (uracil1498-N3)-methyltransferase
VTGAPVGFAADAGAAAHVFVDELADSLTLDGADGHHLQRVRRLRAGEAVTVADGRGLWRPYDVTDVAPGRLTLTANGATCREPELAPRVGVALALTKGGLDRVVAALTELGVQRVEPLRTRRSVARWDGPRASAGLARLRAVAREAAAQCRRARVPDVGPLVDVAGLARRPGVVVADRTGVPAAALDAPDGGEWTLVVGPEGGFDPGEDAALVGVPRLRVGHHVLRAETAPIAACAVLIARSTPVFSVC